MSETLPSGVLVSALLRRVNDGGGMAMVRARGDAQSGAILLILNEQGADPRLLERAIGPLGKPVLVAAGPAERGDLVATESYWRRRRDRDRDLWVIELDVPSAERFAAETILDG